jgi:hypothetical protein
MTKAKPTDAEIEKMLQERALTDAAIVRMLQKKDVRLRSYGIDPYEWADAPRWSDAEAQLEYLRKRVLGYWTLMFPFRSEEELAFEAALRGKPQKLADLIRRPDSQLAPSTRALVAEFLDGTRKLSTGRAKGETTNDAGAPKQSEKLRRAFSPAHRATEIFFLLQETLKQIYREQSEAQIRDRAMVLATMLVKGVKTDTIKNYLEKRKNSKNPLPYRIYGYHEEDNPSGKWWSPDLL